MFGRCGEGPVVAPPHGQEGAVRIQGSSLALASRPDGIDCYSSCWPSQLFLWEVRHPGQDRLVGPTDCSRSYPDRLGERPSGH